MKRKNGLCMLFAALVVLGCGADAHYGGVVGSGGDYGGGFGENIGATPGGAQDIAYARTLIAEGQIPPADTITVEGLLSEHDLRVAGEPCDDLLCVRPSFGVAPSLETGENEAWVQLGMVSGIKASEFQRPPIDAVVLVDRSSSMSIDMAETAHAVNTIIDKLGRNDRLAVLMYNSGTDVLQPAAYVADIDRTELKRRVSGIKARGGSDLESALESAYGVARRMGSSSARMSRVYLLSCGYPNSGAESDFIRMVKAGADDGIGLTFLGVLLSYDYMLADAIGNERGGNYFYAESLDRVETIFEEEFDYISTPLAYDLKMKLGVADNYEIAQIYGLPGSDGDRSAAIETSTAFASKRKGGIVARLRTKDREASGDVATVSWSYTPETAHGFTDPVQAEVGLQHDRGLAETHYDSDGVRKAAALVNMAERMRDAIEKDDVTILVELRDYLQVEAIALDDAQLLDEVELVEALIALF